MRRTLLTCESCTRPYTVSGDSALRVLRDVGVSDVAVVAEQFEPDPTFPTTPFPNPEEAGTLDLALALGRERGADLVVANDPDADRLLASAVLHPRAAGESLKGDEVGWILGAAALRTRSR
jgi:phosphomannomutase